jgi:ComF family protein
MTNVSETISIFLNKLFDLIFHSNCRVCKLPLDDNRKLCICSSCWLKIEIIREPLCKKCGIPLYAAGVGRICGNCIKDKNYFSIARSIGVYDGTLREAIHLFKYKSKTLLGNYFAELIKDKIDNDFDYKHKLLKNIDYVLPVPLHKKKLKQREYNQSMILSRIVSEYTNIPILPDCLVRIKTTTPQSKLPRKKRFENIKGVFDVKKPENIHNKTLLLVDDIFTTGATINECSKVLLKYGAKETRVLTLSHATI